jgi:hypothetical protein
MGVQQRLLWKYIFLFFLVFEALKSSNACVEREILFWTKTNLICLFLDFLHNTSVSEFTISVITSLRVWTNLKDYDPSIETRIRIHYSTHKYFFQKKKEKYLFNNFLNVIFQFLNQERDILNWFWSKTKSLFRHLYLNSSALRKQKKTKKMYFQSSFCWTPIILLN